jgi:hypothetical protein
VKGRRRVEGSSFRGESNLFSGGWSSFWENYIDERGETVVYIVEKMEMTKETQLDVKFRILVKIIKLFLKVDFPSLDQSTRCSLLDCINSSQNYF